MYMLPKIVNNMHKLEGLQYVTALDINMGYYTIRLSPTSQHMATVVTKFVNSGTPVSRWECVLQYIYSKLK